jgi:hypothetical protein
LPKQYVTIEEKRVAVADITSKEKPFPFSTIYHDEGVGMLDNDMQHLHRDLLAFEQMKQDDYARKNIRKINSEITSKLMEIQYRKEMCKKHKLRYGAN